MKSKKFSARFTRNAVATTLASVCLMPQIPARDVLQDHGNAKAAAPGGNLFQNPKTFTTSGNVTLTISPSEIEWTKANEKEFRRLAIKEATQNLTPDEMRRLNWLSGVRDRNSNPATAEEVLLQIRRDRIVEKLAEVLKDYVQFIEGANTKGTAS